MATVIWSGAEFPVLSFSYAAAVGISPQTAFLRVVPTADDPAAFGDLTFGDGDFALTLRDCLVVQARASHSQGGRVWDLAIADRRWMWEIGPSIRGQYNQIDAHGKLIPWTVRSPYQLAVLCLTVLGETNYTIDLPGGLAYPNVTNDVPPLGPNDVAIDPVMDYLNMGENLPPTSTAPPTTWNEIPAAQALASLAEQFGRVVVWDPITDTVSIQLEGGGTGLPDGPTLNSSPAMTPKQIPSQVEIVGSPTRFQVRLQFEAVGRDWDDSWQRLNDLSYTPIGLAPQPMKVWFKGSNSGVLALTLNGLDYAATASQLVGLINGEEDGRVKGHVVASIDSGTGALVLTGVEDGEEFWFDLHGNTAVTALCIDGPVAEIFGFEACQPPLFGTVEPTDRLSYEQATELARSSVYTCYRLVVADPFDDRKEKITIPLNPDDPNEVREITNPFQLLLQASRPDQIAPRPGDVDRVNPLNGQPIAVEVYNGYSRDRAPAAFGSVARNLVGNILYATDRFYLTNTARTGQFYIPFQIVDAERQVIAFAEPVYRILGGEPGPDGNLGTAAIMPANVVLETGVQVLEEFLQTPIRFAAVLGIPGGLGPPLTVVRPDVQEEIIGEYDANHQLIGSHVFDDDASYRADYYAVQIAARYQTTAGQVNTYAGLVAISLSGVVRQVGWSMSSAGFLTTGSANTEFSTVVPPYPARRRRENLPPDALQALQNLRSSPRAAAAHGLVNAVRFGGA